MFALIIPRNLYSVARCGSFLIWFFFLTVNSIAIFDSFFFGTFYLVTCCSCGGDGGRPGPFRRHVGLRWGRKRCWWREGIMLATQISKFCGWARLIYFVYPPPPHITRVMGCGAAEATGLGFVCILVINPRVLSANRILGFLFHKFPPP